MENCHLSLKWKVQCSVYVLFIGNYLDCKIYINVLTKHEGNWDNIDKDLTELEWGLYRKDRGLTLSQCGPEEVGW